MDEVVSLLTNEAFFTGVYMGVILMIPVALWALVCVLINRSLF